MDAKLARLYRDLGHLGHVGAEGVHNRDSSRAALGGDRVPPRDLGHRIQNSLVTRMVHEERATVLVGILARSMGQLVHERLDHEPIV